MPLTATMSTAVSLELAAELALAGGCAPGHLSPEMAGLSPETDRYSSIASTRRSTRPLWTSWRPHEPSSTLVSWRTCGSSCCLDSSSTCPSVGDVERKGFSPLALKIELCSRDTQPSSTGFGSISGAPAPAGRIWNNIWEVASPFAARWPRTVPAMTCTPACNGCRKTSFVPSRKTRGAVAGGCPAGLEARGCCTTGALGAVSSPAAASCAKPDTAAPADTGERGWAPAVAGPVGRGSGVPTGWVLRLLALVLACG